MCVCPSRTAAEIKREIAGMERGQERGHTEKDPPSIEFPPHRVVGGRAVETGFARGHFGGQGCEESVR